MRWMGSWVPSWIGVGAAALACSGGLATAPAGAESLPVHGTPEDYGNGPLVPGAPLLEVSMPSLPMRCRPEGWLGLSRVGQSVLPTRYRRRPSWVAALPGDREPPELAATLGDRRVIEVAGGALVALDQGEFGAGLYHLPNAAEHAEPIDAGLSDRIHWIGQARDRIFGVSGLCHGESCAQHKRSVVFEVRLDAVAVAGAGERDAWRIDPVAVLPGCPDEIAIDQAERAVLVATCHGLFRVDELGYTTLATWPSWIPAATDIADVRGIDAPVYFVSFGALIGRFGAGQANWFSVPECAQK